MIDRPLNFVRDYKDLINIILFVITVFAGVIVYILDTQISVYENTIEENKSVLASHQKRIDELTVAIDASSRNFEEEIKKYIEINHGYLSERNKNVDKLSIYFRKHEKRISNIEDVLSEF